MPSEVLLKHLAPGVVQMQLGCWYGGWDKKKLEVIRENIHTLSQDLSLSVLFLTGPQNRDFCAGYDPFF